MSSPSDQHHPVFDAVDALLASVHAGTVLPPPAERARLRQAAGLTEAAIAQALKVRPASVQAWEAGRSEPAGPKAEGYRRLLEGLAAKFPTPAAAPTPDPVNTATAPAAHPRTTPPLTHTPPPTAAAPAGPRRTPTGAPRPAADGNDQRFTNGPLLVLDGDGHAYGVGGLVLPCPAATFPDLVDWALNQARIGAARLHPAGTDTDPLVVLTATAAQRLGLPSELADRRGLRLPQNHPVLQQIEASGWKLTRRGFGPWPRVYLPVTGGRRQCVQFAILPWDALDARAWGRPATRPAPEVARVLGEYATGVLTPCGSTAVTGQQLMTALRPPTRAVRGESATGWLPGAVPGSLTLAVDPAPPEAPDEHPLVAAVYPRGHQRTPAQALNEEACEWSRDPELLTDAECAMPCAVGVDVNMAFAAATSRLTVGLGEAVHVHRPVFDKKLPGSWLVDLSHLNLDPRLPSPFTPHGTTPTGPAWYATPTLAYAHELIDTLHLDTTITPLEGWLRPNAQQLDRYAIAVPPAAWESGDSVQLARLGLDQVNPALLHSAARFDNGPYLDPWYATVRDAYLAAMAQLGVTPAMAPAEFLAAMEHHKDVDPGAAAVLAAIKATVKGGVGKLRERPQNAQHTAGEPWPALTRPTWRPDIRAAIISTARTNMHRKILNLALKADLFPVAVLSDCVVYPSAGPSPLDVLPYDDTGKPLPGGFRLGVNPGMVKHEGTQPFLWAAQLLDQGHNPARHIKGTDAVLDGE